MRKSAASSSQHVFLYLCFFVKGEMTNYWNLLFEQVFAGHFRRTITDSVLSLTSFYNFTKFSVGNAMRVRRGQLILILLH